jgi:diketogulonate reductase-like aldo/keto reductase
LIGQVVAGQRDRVFLVSKVWPSHVTGNGVERACAASLARLGTDHPIFTLLQWPNGVTDLSGVVVDLSGNVTFVLDVTFLARAAIYVERCEKGGVL